MQSFFRLPWSSASASGSQPRKDALSKPRRPPAIQIPVPNLLKRKRERSPICPSPASANPHKRLRLANQKQQTRINVEGISQSTPAQASGNEEVTNAIAVTQSNKWLDTTILGSRQVTSGEASPNVGPSPSVGAIPSPPPTAAIMDVSNLTPLQQKIEAQFSLEILLKHRELRLIEQELAKCQVALEQLRRCQLIPYPGNNLASDEAQNVSSGIGPALEPLPGYTRPRYPAPWGVTDGPYTKHYARWLIPDAQFDSIPEETLRSAPAGSIPSTSEGRATRGSIAEQGAVTKARPSRGSITSQLQALPNDYQSPKGKQGPPVTLRRQLDGQWVKLVCKYCSYPKEDFSSAQGFLNHCRIQHKNTFRSHEAAAIACGEPLDKEEVKAASGTQTQMLAAQGGGSSRPTHSSPSSTLNLSLVHPLIKAPAISQSLGELGMSTSSVQVPARSNSQSKSETALNLRQITTYHPTLQDSVLVPSPHTPHLSALMRKRGLGGDLSDLVGLAKTKYVVDALDSPSEGEDDAMRSAVPSEMVQAASVGQAHRPIRGGCSPERIERPMSRKGFARQYRKPPALLHAGTTPMMTHERSASGSSVVLESPQLTPHTMESNPGLVSDDDDDMSECQFEFDHNAQSPERGEYMHVEVDDGGDRISARHGHGTESEVERTSRPKEIDGGLSGCSRGAG